MQYADRQRSARSLEWRCWEQWQGAQQIFARSSPTSWVQHGQISTLGLPGTPLGGMRCSAIAPEHFATIGGHVGSLAPQRATLHGAPRALALGPGRSRQRATPRHVAARLAVRFALPSPQCPAAPSPSFLCAWAQPLLPPEAAQELSGVQQLPAGLQEDLRPQVHQLALAWRPGKGTEDTPFLGGDPAPSAAIWVKSSRDTKHMAHISQAPDLLSQAQSEPLRSRLDPLDRE